MDDIRLYILMRTDMASMNPGKAMAQASHAYGALKVAIRHSLGQPEHAAHVSRYFAWQKQTDQDFGTTIVLGGSEREIEDAVTFVKNYQGGQIIAGWVFDPTYPLVDGAVTHLVPVQTCAFVFGKKEDCDGVLSSFALHP